MIIEFFGPPSAGKTTLALALAARLRADGRRVAENFSLRPAEQPPASVGETRRFLSGPALRRVVRPFREMMTPAARSSPRSLKTEADFLRTLPPRSPLWAFRLRRYLSRLETEWEAAVQVEDIALFDQAYVQLICSLGLLSSRCERARLARLLKIRPEPDMLILVDAPRETLERRLKERSRSQSYLERQFEFDLKTNLASIGVIDEIADLLARDGRSYARISSVDPSARQTVFERVARRLAHHSPPVMQSLRSLTR